MPADDVLDVPVPGGTTLRAHLSGHPAAPPVLLLAGQATSSAWWTVVGPLLARSFRTVSFDYRGTGETRGPDGEWSTDLFADDAVAVLEAAGIASAHVVGTSMGGRVAQMLAGRHPERVDGLVLACTSPGGPGAAERSDAVRAALATPDPAERRRVLLDLFFTPGWPAREQHDHLLGDRTMSPRAARRHRRMSDTHDARAVLPGIVAPTLVLHGDADEMTPPANLDLLTGAIPGATGHLVAGLRHGFFEERADWFVDTVATHLGRS